MSPPVPLLDALRRARSVIEQAKIRPGQEGLAAVVVTLIDRVVRVLEEGPDEGVSALERSLQKPSSQRETIGALEREVARLVASDVVNVRLHGEALGLLDERRFRALDVNNDVVQRLTVAKLALDLNCPEESAEALDGALEAARRIITELLRGSDAEVRLGPGDLRVDSAWQRDD